MARRNWKQCRVCGKKISVRVSGDKCFLCDRKARKDKST